MGNFWIVPQLHSVSNTLRKVSASKVEEVTGDWLVYPPASVPFEFELRTKHLKKAKNEIYQLP